VHKPVSNISLPSVNINPNSLSNEGNLIYIQIKCFEFVKHRSTIVLSFQ
jgi:hypothetical protein